MHQTRQNTPVQWPVPRKGTKYVASARLNKGSSVPVVVAIRDMLHLAKTSKEVKEMIKKRLITINDRTVYDLTDTVKLFSLLKADKTYQLTLLPTGKFVFSETKSKERPCKVVNKTLVSKGKIQINLSDGSNILAANNIKVGDTVYMDSSNKMKKHLAVEKGAEVLVFSGKYSGTKGKIKSIEGNTVLVSFKDKEANLPNSSVLVL